VYGGERPVKVLAGGHLNDHGTDESVSITFLYSGARTATLALHTKVLHTVSSSISSERPELSEIQSKDDLRRESPRGNQRLPLSSTKKILNVNVKATNFFLMTKFAFAKITEQIRGNL
jgi:hypothetical protein